MSKNRPVKSHLVTEVSSNLRSIGPIEYVQLTTKPTLPDLEWDDQFHAAWLGKITRTKNWEKVYLVEPGAKITCGNVGEKDEHLHFSMTFDCFAVVMVPGGVPHMWLA